MGAVSQHDNRMKLIDLPIFENRRDILGALFLFKLLKGRVLFAGFIKIYT